MKLQARFCALLLGLLFCTLTGCATTQALPDITTSAPATPSPAPHTQALIIPSHIAALAGATNLAAQGQGIEQQPDGSLVYNLTSDEKAAMLKGLKEHLDAYLAEIPKDWPFVEQLTLEAPYKAITLFTKNDRYNPTRDSKIGGALYAPIALYRCFSGFETPADFALELRVVDIETAVEIAVFSYPSAPSAIDKTGDTLGTSPS